MWALIRNYSKRIRPKVQVRCKGGFTHWQLLWNLLGKNRVTDMYMYLSFTNQHKGHGILITPGHVFDIGQSFKQLLENTHVGWWTFLDLYPFTVSKSCRVTESPNISRNLHKEITLYWFRYLFGCHLHLPLYWFKYYILFCLFALLFVCFVGWLFSRIIF